MSRDPSGNEPVEIGGCSVKRATDKALLCSTPAGEIWIPRSQIFDDSEVHNEGTTGTLIIPRWLAEAKALA